jgi:hypothetical protein
MQLALYLLSIGTEYITISLPSTGRKVFSAITPLLPAKRNGLDDTAPTLVSSDDAREKMHDMQRYKSKFYPHCELTSLILFVSARRYKVWILLGQAWWGNSNSLNM